MNHYFIAYERHFGRFVGASCTFLEIGAGNGGSSQMWKHWLGPLARIVSIDINPLCKQFEDNQIAIRIGDQTDAGFLQSLVDEFGRFDVVLDDGSHHVKHVLASFEFLYPRMAMNGVYMVEDVHAAYWSEYGGGLNKGDTIVDVFKDTVDLLNIDHVRDQALQPSELSKSTFTITAYDSVLVFERTSYINKANVMLGDNSLRHNY